MDTSTELTKDEVLVPDMEASEYEQAKRKLIDQLKNQSLQRLEIERKTVLQAKSYEWHEIRKHLLTASHFAKICKRRENQNSAPLVEIILYSSRGLDNIPSIKHGKENEDLALEQLSSQENLNIKRCGIFIDEEYFFLGATPDRVCEEELVEIKCPSSLYGTNFDDAPEPVKKKYFKMNSQSQVEMNTNSDNYYQIQGQLQIANKNVCVFAIWTGLEFPLKVVRVERDLVFWQEKMLPKLVRFYQECILPEIIDPRKTRSMPLRKIIL